MGILDKFGFKTTPPAPQMILSKELLESTGAHADYDTVQAVVNYVNAAQAKAFLRPQELPPLALQVYEVDRYLAQVNNGGHAQYEHNCHRHFDMSLPAVEAGLRAMGAKPFLKIFRQFRTLLDKHQIEQAMTEPGKYRDILEPLDKRFFAADKATPLSGFSARLIRRSRPRLVPNDALDAAYAEMAAENPFRATREEVAKVAALSVWFCTPQMVGAGMLLGSAEEPDMLERILPGQVVLYQNQHTPAMRLKTATGMAHAVYMFDLYTLHDEATPEEQAAERQRRQDGRDPEPGVDWHHYAFLLQGIGRRRAAVLPEIVETMCKLTAARHVPLAAFELLRGAGLNAPSQVGWLGDPVQMIMGRVSWVFAIDGAYFTMVMSDTGLSLYERGNDTALGQIDDTTLQKRMADLED